MYVASYDHKPAREEKGKWVFVDPGRDAADLYVINHAKRGDVLITQDIGLASLALGKGVYAISPRGTVYKEETIGTALDLRYLSAQARRLGIYDKGPKAFTEADRKKFLMALRRILSTNEGDRNNMPNT